MARQSGMSTPIFDELVREMAEGKVSEQPSPVPSRASTPLAAPQLATPQWPNPAPRRRHRAE